MRRTSLVASLFVACLTIAAGCSGRPARVVAPRIDPAAVTEAVFQAADEDRDGALRGGEQKIVPAIAAAAERLDGDGDGAVSRDELSRWLTAVRDARVAINRFEMSLTHRGRPLAGADVRLVPEPFMGSEIQVAEGTTDAQGVVVVAIPGAKYVGANCGLYRVAITGTDNNGKPLSERFATSPTLGVAVGGGIPESGAVRLSLD
jgi:hypothetical protein